MWFTSEPPLSKNTPKGQQCGCGVPPPSSPRTHAGSAPLVLRSVINQALPSFSSQAKCLKVVGTRAACSAVPAPSNNLINGDPYSGQVSVAEQHNNSPSCSHSSVLRSPCLWAKLSFLKQAATVLPSAISVPKPKRALLPITRPVRKPSFLSALLMLQVAQHSKWGKPHLCHWKPGFGGSHH